MGIEQATAAADRLDLRLIAGRIGAEIRGVILTPDLPGGIIESIKAALLRHKVIFFRGQDHLTDDTHEDFAGRLGLPVGHPTVASRSGRVLFQLDSLYGGKASSWHSDSTYVHDYPWATVLRSVTLPALGGDTMWANMVSGYHSLPAPLRDFADRVRTVHSNLFDYTVMRPDDSPETLEKMRKASLHTIYEAEHPMVRVIPSTDERAVILGHFFKRFVGMNEADSQKLYSIFQEHLLKPENTVRWAWRVGDVAIWDNRMTQHYALDDYVERRVMRRVTLAGETAVGIDGRASRQLKPEPAE
jgi:alpha-ketoglutarate-dependent sulfate ester dioxygenase